MSIKQRNGIWWIDFRSPSGERIRRSTGTRVKKAAQEYHDRLKAEYWRADMLGEEIRTFDQAALEMLKLSEGQSDYETKLRHVKYWRDALGGDTPLRSLTGGMIVQALPTHSTHAHRKPTPLSAASKNRYLSTMRRILNLANQWGWIAKTPHMERYDEPSKRVRWERQNVISALINALHLPWMRDVCLVAVATGMREDELLSLLPMDVDLQQSTAWVRAENAKSGYARAVPLNADALAVIERRIKTATTYVFERPPQRKDGEIIKIFQTDARDFKRACAKVGIEDFRFHDLRHTWASWHAQSGTPLMVLKELGGWETLEMVQRYAHLAPSHLAHHASSVTFWAQQAGKEKEQPCRVALMS
ncbi:tyrosine-type recombinase/integrase [Paenalcaligenes suwonensis]|uniref:tyrosine-type recombinase/integrase n=1 Tax=Paenalcaligenes suwonensis TaxID=1202713 RepID=UPI00140AD858|nr:site-specific integrase [Paenalcaligenes suwonensis]NHC62908.1 site-specific integrase [Paenalcaligenes suwonensis]